MENFEKCTVAMLGGPCSQHVTGNTSRLNQPQNAIMGLTPLPQKANQYAKTYCNEAFNLIWVGAYFKWGGGSHTHLMYWATDRSKLDHCCFVYGTLSNTKLWQFGGIRNTRLWLALGVFCTSPVPSVYTQTNESSLEERRIKLFMHYYLKHRACIDNPTNQVMRELDQTSRGQYAPGQMGEEARPDIRHVLLVSR